jgi:hypothetical protein
MELIPPPHRPVILRTMYHCMTTLSVPLEQTTLIHAVAIVATSSLATAKVVRVALQ